MIKLIIFDIDGTLIDTTELFLQAYEYTMNVHDLEKKSREELREIISVSRTILESYQKIAPLKDFEKLVATHHEFRKKNIHLATAFPHSVSVLTTLREKGFKVAGLTNRVSLVAETLQETKIEGLLDPVLTAGDAGYHKPHPAGIIKILEHFNISQAEAIMVGDTSADVLAGKAAGVAATVGLTTGFGPRQVVEAGADYVIHDIQDLLPLISTI